MFHDITFKRKHFTCLKGTKRHKLVKLVKIFKTEKALEIQLARLTEAFGKVSSEKNV